MLNLEGRNWVTGVGLQIEKGLCLGIGDADGLCDAGVDNFLERFPGLAKRDVLELDRGVLGVLPPGLEKSACNISAVTIIIRWNALNGRTLSICLRSPSVLYNPGGT